MTLSTLISHMPMLHQITGVFWCWQCVIIFLSASQFYKTPICLSQSTQISGYWVCFVWAQQHPRYWSLSCSARIIPVVSMKVQNIIHLLGLYEEIEKWRHICLKKTTKNIFFSPSTKTVTNSITELVCSNSLWVLWRYWI